MTTAPRRAAGPGPAPRARRSTPSRRRVRLVVLPVLAAVVVALAVVGGTHDDHLAEATSTPYLPFDMPSTSELRASPRKVFANYFTPLPISLDNRPPASDYYARNYLSPAGENGEHAAYGGLLRDRPLPRAPLASPDWRLDDLETEVREAVSAGIDGFYLDMLQLPGDPDVRVWETTQLMMKAAAAVDPGFKIVLMPDLTGGMKDKSAAELARYTAQLAASPSAYRLADGRLVLMPTAAEAHPAAWWRGFMSIMDEQYHLPVALVPVFIADEAPYRDSFAPISYAMSTWGSANPQWNDPEVTYATSPKGRAAAVHDLGKLWVQPVRVQDERPNQGVFNEAENTTNLRNTWQLARETNAEWVHIPTWNDYAEGAQIAPTVEHGYTYLDLTAYYLAWYKTGVRPRIVRDVVYLTHRKQPFAAAPTYPQDSVMKLKGGSPARDTIEALTFLTAPGRVTIQAGGTTHTCDAPAGVGVCTVSLGLGTISASVSRGGAVVAEVTSPYPVTATPYVQDLQYVGASSARTAPPGAADLGAEAVAEPAGTRGSPTPTATGGAPSTPTTVSSTSSTSGTSGSVGEVVSTVSPDADTYVNQAARTTSYLDETSLASRGKPGYVGYLYFTLPAAPEGRRLVGARLRLSGSEQSYAGSDDEHQVNLEPRGVVDAKTTWANRPAVSGPVVGTFDGDLDRGRTRTTALDTDDVRRRLGAGVLLTVSSRGDDNWWFSSSEVSAPDRRPALVLTFR